MMKSNGMKRVFVLAGCVTLTCAAYAMAGSPNWNVQQKNTTMKNVQVRPQLKPGNQNFKIQLNRKMDLKIEKFTVRTNLTGLEKAEFLKDRAGFIAKELEKAGFSYRKVLVDPTSQASDCNCYHIVYPENEACIWFCE